MALIALGIVVRNFGVAAAEKIRVATFGMIAVAPVVLLIGLLDARLARSTVGDLFVELRDDPAPADLRDALAERPARSVLGACVLAPDSAAGQIWRVAS